MVRRLRARPRVAAAVNAGPYRLPLPGGVARYTIGHRPRVTRRMHLELDEAGELRVIVPRGWSVSETHRLLERHAARVQRYLDGARERRLPPLHYGDGGEHLYRGERLTLRLRRRPTATRPILRRDGDTLLLLTRDPGAIGTERVRRLLSAWYGRQARRLFRRRFERLRGRASWTAERDLELAQRRMTRTWGSCRRDGVIRLNTHLVKAPTPCLDYVIAHELCHLRVMNHGPDFYALQERLWPDWRDARAHLREHGHRYTQE
mgnify:CR=1 FL=1